MIARRLRMNTASKSSVRRLISYLTSSQGHEHRVGEVRMTNCGADEPDLAAIEMWATQQMNTRATGDKTYHLVLSFREDEKPTPEIMKAVEDEVVTALGFDGHERISVVHEDTDNLHIHLCINKIHPEKLTMREPYYDHKTLAKTCERLEQSYALKEDNHVFRSEAVETAAKSMEMAGDMESLTGWVQRNLLEDMQKVLSWDEMHGLLAERKLVIKERGNGLIISNGTIHVKASSIYRGFSKKKLEAQLGPFERSQKQGQNRSTTKPSYQKKPMQHKGVDSSALWQKYQQERHILDTVSQKDCAQVQQERQEDMDGVRSGSKLQSQMVSLMVKDPTMRRIIRALNNSSARAKRKAIQTTYKENKTKIPKRISWRDWLKNEAMQNNVEALAAIRARDKRSRKRLEKLKNQPVSITRKGTVIYKNGLRESGLPIIPPKHIQKTQQAKRRGR